MSSKTAGDLFTKFLKHETKEKGSSGTGVTSGSKKSLKQIVAIVLSSSLRGVLSGNTDVTVFQSFKQSISDMQLKSASWDKLPKDKREMLGAMRHELMDTQHMSREDCRVLVKASYAEVRECVVSLSLKQKTDALPKPAVGDVSPPSKLVLLSAILHADVQKLGKTRRERDECFAQVVFDDASLAKLTLSLPTTIQEVKDNLSHTKAGFKGFNEASKGFAENFRNALIDDRFKLFHKDGEVKFANALFGYFNLTLEKDEPEIALCYLFQYPGRHNNLVMCLRSRLSSVSRKSAAPSAGQSQSSGGVTAGGRFLAWDDIIDKVTNDLDAIVVSSKVSAVGRVSKAKTRSGKLYQPSVTDEELLSSLPDSDNDLSAVQDDPKYLEDPAGA